MKVKGETKKKGTRPKGGGVGFWWEEVTFMGGKRGSRRRQEGGKI